MYAAGGAHPYNSPCQEVLALAARHPRAFVTSVEVLQELLHRYLASQRWDSGRRVLAQFSALMRDRVEPVYARDVEVAAELAERHTQVNARDLVHAAAMQRLGIESIVSADRHFDGIPGITRLDPANVEEWRDSVLAAEGV